LPCPPKHEADITVLRALSFSREECSKVAWHRGLSGDKKLSEQRCSSVAPREGRDFTYK